MKKIICYLSASSGDWGGASRVLFTNLKFLNREKYEPILLLPGEGPILPQLDEQKIRYELWGDWVEFEKIWPFFARVLKTIWFLKKNKVDILHINHASYWRPAEVLGAKIARVPLISHYHVPFENPGPFLKLSNMMVTNSQFTANASAPTPAAKRVVYCTVDTTRFDNATDIRPELDLGKGDIVVTFVGQIRENKGVDLFIEMAHRIPGDNIRFIIVGECRDTDKYAGAYTPDRLAVEIEGDQRIRHIGYRSDVENVYKSSDIIVVPSRWDEPFGLINIEAGASKKPVVASKVGGIPEIIEDGVNGFLVERDDVDGFVQRVSELIANADLRQKIGEKAREVVEKRFTSAPVRELEKIYDELIG